MSSLARLVLVVGLLGTFMDQRAPNIARSAPELEPDFFDLGGGAGLPSYLRTDFAMLGDAQGLRGGEARTITTDFNEKDFVFDVLFKFNEDEKNIALIGIGGTGRDALAMKDSICSRIHGPGYGGYATLYVSGLGDKEFVRFKTAGPHLFRLEKQGDTLKLGVGAWSKGKFEPIATQSLQNLKTTAPFLNGFTSSLFIWGNTTFMAVRLSVDGKLVQPGKPAPPPDAAIDKLPILKLSSKNKLPSFLRLQGAVRADPNGINGGVLRSADFSLSEKDFAFDVLFRFPPDDRSICSIGLGGSKPGPVGWEESVSSRVHGPGHGGYGTVFVPGKTEHELGKFVTPGPHLFRLEKRGDTLTMAIGKPPGTGKFEPILWKTIPNLRSVAPFLTKQTSPILVDCNGAIIEGVRMTVNGRAADNTLVAKLDPKVEPKTDPKPEPKTDAKTKPDPKIDPKAKVDPKTDPAKTTKVVSELAGKEHLIALTRGNKLPSYFLHERDLVYDAKQGLRLGGRVVRTAASDFQKKDFTFDVVFRFPDEKDQGILVVGMGNPEGANLNSWVGSRIHGPGHGGYGTFTVSGQAEQSLGKFLTAGPHLFRLQKKGNHLTMAISVDFKGKVSSDIEQAVLDLKSAAPYFDRGARLFMGHSGIVDAVRLAVDGEPIETRDIVLDLPAAIIEGQPLSQDLGKAAPGRGFVMENAPKGFQVSPIGKLSWTPAADQKGRHPLRFILARAKDAPLAVVSEIDVVSAEDAKAVGGDPTKVLALYQVPLAGERYQLAPGLDGKSLLLLQGNQVQRLIGNGTTVKETLKLPASYERIAERPEYFVALSDEKKSLDLIDKKTLTVRRRIGMDYFRRFDLALHPRKPICYVTVDDRGREVYSNRILIVEEKSGEVFEPRSFYGTWVLVHPNGNELYAGYKDLYEETLRIYDISRDKPLRLSYKEEAGGNGTGIALSPDGKRLSYLSVVGYPRFSGNIPGWDPTNLEKRPVSYATHDQKASAQWIAFHPTLEMVAAASESGAVCFHRETGEFQADRVNLHYPPRATDTRYRRTFFSPDGRHLLVEAEDAGQRHLHRLPLKLTAAEVEKLPK